MYLDRTHTHIYIHLVKNTELKKAQETLSIIRGVFFFSYSVLSNFIFLNISYILQDSFHYPLVRFQPWFNSPGLD